VVVRFRPLNDQEKENEARFPKTAIKIDEEKDSMKIASVAKPDNPKTFNFDEIIQGEQGVPNQEGLFFSFCFSSRNNLSIFFLQKIVFNAS